MDETQNKIIPAFELIDVYRRECAGDLERMQELAEFLAYERFKLGEDIASAKYAKQKSE